MRLVKKDMTIQKNPFDTTFSGIPPVYIETKAVHDCLFDVLTGSSSTSYFITGVRGSGKTVMMNRIVKALLSKSKDELGYEFYHVPLLSNGDMIVSLFEQLQRRVRRFSSDFKSLTVGFPGLFNVSLNMNQRKSVSLQSAIVEMMRILSKRNIHVLISIDEVSPSNELSIFGQLLNLIKSEQLAMTVIMTGLPEMIDKIKNMQNLTFLYRSQQIFTDTLDEAKMADAYVQHLGCSFGYAMKLAKASMGYPYAFQVLGSVTFKQINYRDNGIQPTWDSNLFKLVVNRTKDQLFSAAYTKLYTELPHNEQVYLSNVKSGQHLTEMANEMHWSTALTGRYRKILLQRRLIKPVNYGVVDFALPYFGEYIEKTKDENSLYFLGE